MVLFIWHRFWDVRTWLLGDACVVGLVGQASKEPGRPGLVWVAVEGCPEELPSVLPRHCRSGLSCSFVASSGCQSYLDSGFSNAFLLSGKASPSLRVGLATSMLWSAAFRWNIIFTCEVINSLSTGHLQGT